MTQRKQSIQNIIYDVLDLIQINDQMIIRKGQELALSNKIGMYLSQKLPGWHVDCEYNRVGFNDGKKLASAGNKKRPDIIIHRRGHQDIDSNLLWIEVKVENISINDDVDKLKEFTSAPSGARKVQYLYGLSISFVPAIKLVWVKNGVEDV